MVGLSNPVFCHVFLTKPNSDFFSLLGSSGASGDGDDPKDEPDWDRICGIFTQGSHRDAPRPSHKRSESSETRHDPRDLQMRGICKSGKNDRFRQASKAGEILWKSKDVGLKSRSCRGCLQYTRPQVIGYHMWGGMLSAYKIRMLMPDLWGKVLRILHDTIPSSGWLNNKIAIFIYFSSTWPMRLTDRTP